MFADPRIAPPIGTPIDWASPIATGLQCCFVAQSGSTSLIDAAGGRALTATGAISPVGSPYGSAVGSNSTASHWTGATLGNVFGSGATLAILTRVRVTTAAAFLFGQNTPTGVNYDIGIYNNSSDIVFYRRSVTSGVQFLSTAFTANSWVLMVGTWDGSQLQIWLNGVPRNTLSHTGATSYQGLATSLGRFSSASSAQMDVALAAAWSRALTGAQIQSLADQPFGLFAQSRPQLWAATQPTFSPGWLSRTPVLGSGVY